MQSSGTKCEKKKKELKYSQQFWNLYTHQREKESNKLQKHYLWGRDNPLPVWSLDSGIYAVTSTSSHFTLFVLNQI